jgi:protein-arginine kinase
MLKIDMQRINNNWGSSIDSMPLFNPASTCLSKKYLTEAYWLQAHDLQSRSGCTLLSMLRSGMAHSDSKIGVYAGDPDCYETFSGLLDPLLADFHGLNEKPFHAPQEVKAAIGNWNLNASEILSTRIRVARNLQGYPFTPQISGIERAELEMVVSQTLKKLPGTLAGTYNSYAKLSPAQSANLLKHNLLFDRGDRFQAAAGIARDWPVGRGVFASHDHRFSVWVNEEDHLRIISTQPGGNLSATYTHLGNALRHIEKELSFEYSERIGYLASCPSNVGTSLRASFHIRLPQLEQYPQHLQAIVATHGLALRGTKGEHSKVTNSVYDVSNRQRLGISTLGCLRRLWDGTTALLRIERKLASIPRAKHKVRVNLDPAHIHLPPFWP